MDNEKKSIGDEVDLNELPFNAKVKDNVLEITSKHNYKHEKLNKVGLYLFDEADAEELSTYQMEMYSNKEKFERLESELPSFLKL